uniref:Candidate secreted effector n=2 Tax=Meloidogyne TaxID=189290 RepID=A0A914LJQ5_MELIC
MFRQMLGEFSSICFGICRSSSGICLESVFVGVLTDGVWNSPGICLEFFICLCGGMFRLMCGGITQHCAKDSCDNVQKFRQMLGECSSICFGICRSSFGICLESGFVGVLTDGVWNSPGICLEFFLLFGVARSGWHLHGTCCFYGTLITAHQLYVPCL